MNDDRDWQINPWGALAWSLTALSWFAGVPLVIDLWRGLAS